MVPHKAVQIRRIGIGPLWNYHITAALVEGLVVTSNRVRCPANAANAATAMQKNAMSQRMKTSFRLRARECSPLWSVMIRRTATHAISTRASTTIAGTTT